MGDSRKEHGCARCRKAMHNSPVYHGASPSQNRARNYLQPKAKPPKSVTALQ